MCTCPSTQAETANQSTVVIWALSDGKRGHENQVRGLIDALGRRVATNPHVIKSPSQLVGVGLLLLGRFPAGRGLPDPDLLLGAGHQTHPSLLAARRARGGRAVVLMKPTLSTRLFDLVIAPQHDKLAPRPNLVATYGAINAIRPGGEHRQCAGLVLLGGPSNHHGWDEAGVVQRLAAIIASDPQRRWQLTTSRRTPPAMLAALRQLPARNLTITPWEQTGPGWVGERLGESAAVWVTEDSVSMVYEALTSGAAVGVLPLPRRGSSRVVSDIDRLVDDGLVTTFDAWRDGSPLRPPDNPPREADRCAQIILQRWFGAN